MDHHNTITDSVPLLLCFERLQIAELRAYEATPCKDAAVAQNISIANLFLKGVHVERLFPPHSSGQERLGC